MSRHRSGPKKSGHKALAVTLAASYGIQALNIMTGLLIARGLVPSDRGSVAAATLYPTLVAAIISFGLFDSLAIHLSRLEETAHNDESNLVNTSVALVSFEMILGIPAAYFVFGSTLHGPTLSLARLYLAWIPLAFFTLVAVAVLQGRQQFARFNLARMTVQFVTAALLGALYVGNKISATTICLVYILAEAGTVCIAWRLVGRFPSVTSASRRHARAIVSLGLRTQFSSLSSLLNERGDQMVLAVMLPGRELGIYAVAVSLVSPIGVIGPSVASHAMVRRGHANEGRTDLAVTAGATIILAILVSLLCPSVIRIFIPKYLEATSAVRLLAIASVPLALNKVMEARLKAGDHPGWAGFAEVLGLTTSISCLLTLGSRSGATGAAVSSIGGYSVALMFLAAVGVYQRLATSQRRSGPVKRVRSGGDRPSRALDVTQARRHADLLRDRDVDDGLHVERLQTLDL